MIAKTNSRLIVTSLTASDSRAANVLWSEAPRGPAPHVPVSLAVIRSQHISGAALHQLHDTSISDKSAHRFPRNGGDKGQRELSAI